MKPALTPPAVTEYADREKLIPLRPVQALMPHEPCPAIGKVGYLQSTGRLLINNPPTYEHRCSACALIVPLRAQYPHMRFIEEPEPDGEVYDIHTTPQEAAEPPIDFSPVG